MSDDYREGRPMKDSLDRMIEMPLPSGAVTPKPIWQDAWREFQDPYLEPDNTGAKFPSPFESFVAGYIAAARRYDRGTP